jgi:hypothetical protein
MPDRGSLSKCTVGPVNESLTSSQLPRRAAAECLEKYKRYFYFEIRMYSDLTTSTIAPRQQRYDPDSNVFMLRHFVICRHPSVVPAAVDTFHEEPSSWLQTPPEGKERAENKAPTTPSTTRTETLRHFRRPSRMFSQLQCRIARWPTLKLIAAI